MAPPAKDSTGPTDSARELRALILSRAVYARQLRQAIDRRDDAPPAAPERPAQAV